MACTLLTNPRLVWRRVHALYVLFVIKHKSLFIICFSESVVFSLFLQCCRMFSRFSKRKCMVVYLKYTVIVKVSHTVHVQYLPLWQTRWRADAVCIKNKQMLLATPAILSPCSILDRNQLKKYYRAVSQPFSLQPAVTLHKLTPQISPPVLSFERKFCLWVFF